MKKLLQLPVALLIVFLLFITCSKDDNTVVQYSLSVEVTPSESGSVSPSSGKYDDGETVTLVATPSAEYIFKNWSRGASGTSNPTTTVMNSNKAVTAVFEKRKYALTIDVEGQGTVNEVVLSAKSNSEYPSGNIVQLTAVPLDGWEFTGWSGDLSGIENPKSITIDKPKNVKATFQSVLYKQIIGKWDVNNLGNKPSSKNSSSKKDSPNLAKTTDGVCIVYSLVFNSDGSFVLSLSSGEINGEFYFDSATSLVLINIGAVTNISIVNTTLNFSLIINNLCSSTDNAEKDDDYTEGECISFLNCNDGNVWVKQTDNGLKYVRVTNDLEGTWIEHYTFDTNWKCTRESITNLTSEYSVIPVENDIEQMTYVLDDTPEGDVQVKLMITADENLSVSYDYLNNKLDWTDYYTLSSEESLNEYLNSYTACTESQSDSDSDGVTNDMDACPDTPSGVAVDINGCPIDFKNSTIWSNYDTENVYLIDSSNKLFKSSDNSETWEYLSQLSFNNRFQLEIVGNVMYAGNDNNIYKSTDEGKTWVSIKHIEENYPYVAYAIDKNSNYIYVVLPYALYRFDGENWVRIKTTVIDNRSICVSVDNNGYVYYGVYLFTIHKSTNNGDDWTSINYQELGQGWSTTGNMYVTDDNILLMNRWWDGIYWLSDNNCLPLNNGLKENEGEMIGTIDVVANGANYYTVLISTEGVLGIYSSSDRGQQWSNSNYNLTQYDLIQFRNISINKSGKVFLSIGGKGCYILNENLNQWDLLQ